MERVLELTDGNGAVVVLDFGGERGAERNVMGNLVGSYNDLVQLMALAG